MRAGPVHMLVFAELTVRMPILGKGERVSTTCIGRRSQLYRHVSAVAMDS